MHTTTNANHNNNDHTTNNDNHDNNDNDTTNSSNNTNTSVVLMLFGVICLGLI